MPNVHTEAEIMAALLLAIDRGDAAVRWVHRPCPRRCRTVGCYEIRGRRVWATFRFPLPPEFRADPREREWRESAVAFAPLGRVLVGCRHMAHEVDVTETAVAVLA